MKEPNCECVYTDVDQTDAFDCQLHNPDSRYNHLLRSAERDAALPAVRYREALEQLRIAADALDQAHSMLRDINMHHIGTGSGPYRLSLGQIGARAFGLVTALENDECDECGRKVSENADCLAGWCAEPARRAAA